MERILDASFEHCRQPAPTPTAFLISLWRQWRIAANARAELRAMDARTREDIGVSEADIARAINRPWWRWPLV